MTQFLSMGGYGAYVWPAFAAFFIVLALELASARAQRRRVLAEIRGRVQRRATRDQGGAQP